MKSDLDALEVNAYPFLVLVGYAASAQRDAQSGRIDRFQKARPESLVNGDGGLDDPRGKRLEFMAHGSSAGSITKTRKYESTKKSRTGTLPCLGCQRPAANAAFWEWTLTKLAVGFAVLCFAGCPSPQPWGVEIRLRGNGAGSWFRGALLRRLPLTPALSRWEREPEREPVFSLASRLTGSKARATESEGTRSFGDSEFSTPRPGYCFPAPCCPGPVHER